MNRTLKKMKFNQKDKFYNLYNFLLFLLSKIFTIVLNKYENKNKRAKYISFFSMSWLFRPHLIHTNNTGNGSKNSCSFTIDFSWKSKVIGNWGVEKNSYSINNKRIYFLLFITFTLK